MITRSKLVEQLRDYQIRSQHKWAALIFFSPKPHITNRADVIVALVWALLFITEETGKEKGEKVVATLVNVIIILLMEISRFKGGYTEADLLYEAFSRCITLTKFEKNWHSSRN
ncbi:hypothetical protein NE237_018781 [Protea cynaroides]|uniref:Uncharacterized protein n=1 Tax=Protea cynaroides TaxID=273540 RepID=A0A9Q0KAJ8_9MAGN|nr:hypothetical protein NE237_018781 [Protea cynaroides]